MASLTALCSPALTCTSTKTSIDVDQAIVRGLIGVTSDRMIAW
jgi:hypothetical protein